MRYHIEHIIFIFFTARHAIDSVISFFFLQVHPLFELSIQIDLMIFIRTFDSLYGSYHHFIWHFWNDSLGLLRNRNNFYLNCNLFRSPQNRLPFKWFSVVSMNDKESRLMSPCMVQGLYWIVRSSLHFNQWMWFSR